MSTALLEPSTSTTSLGHVVEQRDVDLSFGDKRVLNGVSLAIEPQERLVIIGQSGGG
jgi:ABC-type transporter Mla maintaining outer membrane lipid asymmetry ATPase subunit MlaF